MKEDHLFCKFNLGVVLFKLGLFIDSFREYQELTRLYPTNSWVFYNMSVCLIQKGRFTEAIDVINKALQLSLENDFSYRFDIYQLRGVCWFRLGELKKAVADFLKANNIKVAAGYYWNRQIEDTPNQDQSISREESQQQSMTQSRVKFNSISQDSAQNDPLEPLLVAKDQEYGMIAAERIQDRESFKNQISAISQTLVVEKDEEMGFRVTEKKASRSGSGSLDRRRSAGDQDGKKGISTALSQDLLSPQSSQIRRQFRPFMPRLGTDQLSALQRLDAKFQQMEGGGRQKSSKKKIKKQESEDELKREDSQKTTDKNIKAKIYGNKYADTKNYFYINGNRNLRLEKVMGLEKEGLTPDQIAERKRRILTMKEELSDQEQESLEEELQALERPLTTDQNFETPGREDRHSVLQSHLNVDESYHQMKNEDQYDLLDKQFDNLARKLQEFQSPSKQKPPEEPMFANRVISDLTGKKMKKMISKLIRNQEKLQVEGFRKSNDLLTQFNIEIPVVKEQEDSGIMDNVKKSPKGKKLTVAQVEFLRAQFQKSLFDRDIKAIEHETRYLKFFHRFPKDVRMKIFMKCQYHHFKKDEFIFKQEEKGDKLYVILSGSVKVLMKKDIFGDAPIVVATLYDGMQFGELAIFSGLENNDDVTEEQQDYSQLRKASCQACEDVDCISLAKDVSQRILHFEMQKNFSDKLDLLKRVKILKGIQPIHLIPMASNLQAEYYTFGEYIVREGQTPRGFYIISRGQCRVVSTRMARRPQDESKTAQRHNHSKIEKATGKQPMSSQRIAHFSKEVPSSIFELLELEKTRGTHKEASSGKIEGFMRKSAAEVKMVDRTVFSLQHNTSKKRAFQNERLYADDLGNPYDCEVVYNDLMDFGRLLPGESFGARILLTDQIIAAAQNVAKRQLRMIAQLEGESKKKGIEKAISHSQRQAITDEDSKIKKESLLSIIADSDLVEVYVIDKSQLGLLSQEVMEQMARIILTTNEPDRPDLPEILRSQKESYEKWDKYKVKLTRDFMKEQSQERNKHKNLSLNR